MNPLLQRLTRSRLRLYGLAAVAVVLLGLVVVVMVTEDPLIVEEEVFPPMVLPNPDKRPDFIFPESVRTYDLSLNRFVDRFARVCMQARYDDFRLMLSTRNDPIVARRFESLFNAIKQVRIQGIERLPDVPGVDGPVYLLMAEYDLEEFVVGKSKKTDTIQLAIAMEDGEWRIGPVPHEALEQLQGYREETARAKQEGATSQPASADKPVRARPAATANRPARLDG